MAYNAIQDNLYNFYLTTYAPKSITKYDAHKKDELRSHYNSMVKLNKESPLYLIPNPKESARVAVGIKENARMLGNQIASMGGLDSSKLFSKKAAYSSREDLVTAEYIGDSDDEMTDIPDLEMSVEALATEQTNMGRFLVADAPISLPEDTYSFDISINDMNYEFQFNIHDGETNRGIQERLSRLIGNAGIGLRATVINGDDGTSSLAIQSEATGLRPDQDSIFQVTDDKTSRTSGMVNYLGIDYISHEATNALFTIAGEQREASSNNFTLGNYYEIKLHGVSENENDTATIGLKPDSESLADNISTLADHFNGFLSAMDAFESMQHGSFRLKNEFSGIASIYKDQLQEIGIDVDQDGKLAVNKRQLTKAAENGDIENQFGVVKNLTQMLYHKTNQITLNPMKYVDKSVVTYKNPGHNFAAPYVASNYSGMLYNFYC